MLSILANGLLSRKILDEKNLTYYYTDSSRNDKQDGAVSLSIHSINRAMLSAKRRNSDCDWVILEVDASVLWTHPCRSCWRNAASSEIVNHSGYIGGPWALERMFADEPVSAGDKRAWRVENNMLDNMPTRNGAEVQVLHLISPDLVRGVSVARDAAGLATDAVMRAAGRVLPIFVVRDIFE